MSVTYYPLLWIKVDGDRVSFIVSAPVTPPQVGAQEMDTDVDILQIEKFVAPYKNPPASPVEPAGDGGESGGTNVSDAKPSPVAAPAKAPIKKK